MPKFTGVKAAVHIHEEGRLYHFKNGTDNSTRHNFSPEHKKQMEAALKELKATGWDELDGYDKCIKWFKDRGYQ